MKSIIKYSAHVALVLALACAADSAMALKKVQKNKKHTKRAPASEVTSTLDINEDGRVFADGQQVKIRAGRSVNTYMLANVEGVTGVGGDLVFKLEPVEARSKAPNGTTEKTPLDGALVSFLYEEDWRMIDANGDVTDNPHKAAKVIMPLPPGTDAEKMVVTWNECEGPVTGNYSGIPCSRIRGLADVYYAFLRDNFRACATQALAPMGGGTVTKMHIVHDGTTADPRHSRKSLHAAGRAIDFQSVTVTTEKGSRKFDFRITSTQPKSADRQFYEGFRQCWHQLHMARGCQKRESGHPIGTIGWEERRHRSHHLHTSMPFCPHSGKYMVTSFGDDDEDMEPKFKKRNDDDGVDI